MANLKEVRERIRSVISTQQITKAMKMVSAAKLRKAQQAIQQMRPYSNKLSEMLSNILSNMEGGIDSPLAKPREVKKALLVVIASDRGLCGAFNTNVLKAAIRTINEKYDAVRKDNGLSILCIGKKSNDFFRKRYKDCHLINDHVALGQNVSFDAISKLAQTLMDEYVAGKYDSIEIIYAKFKNAAIQSPEVEAFLPVAKMEAKADSKTQKSDYIFEPSKEELLKELIPTILMTQFHKCLLDSAASEHGARMTAMDKASGNADDLLKELRINYNKARQEAITRELSEIVGGSAALQR